MFSVIGAVIGKQKGRNIEIMNSFELKFHYDGDSIIIDKEYYSIKEEQCKLHYLQCGRSVQYSMHMI